jgi:hypothetical protein
MSPGNLYIDEYIAFLKRQLTKPTPRPVAVSLCAPAPTQVCATSQPKAHMLRTLLAVAATLSLCGCPDVAPMPTPSPSATMPPRNVAPARDTATTQQMLHYYFVQ